MSAFLETPRLVLRAFTPEDADLLVCLDADPEVMRFLSGGQPTPRAIVVAEELPRILALRDGYGQWAAHDRATGAFLGWFGLTPLGASLGGPRPGEAELGYRLKRAAWGRGLATEGARALVDKAFADLGMRRVVGETMTVNAGSRRVLEKAGLRFVRTFFFDWGGDIEGGDQGDVEYEITYEEWAAARTPN